jgi:hypothetical protein
MFGIIYGGNIDYVGTIESGQEHTPENHEKGSRDQNRETEKISHFAEVARGWLK